MTGVAEKIVKGTLQAGFVKVQKIICFQQFVKKSAMMELRLGEKYVMMVQTMVGDVPKYAMKAS